MTTEATCHTLYLSEGTVCSQANVLDTWRHNTVVTTGRDSFQYHLFLISDCFWVSNTHSKFLSFLEFLSEKWWLLLFFVKLTLLNEMKWSIWSYSVSNLQPLNLSDIPTCVFQTMLCMYALTMEDLYNYLLKSKLRLQYLSRSMQITVMLSVLLFVSCTISLRQIFTNLHIHSDTWY